ncbi:MAG: copper chaperone PCu(A)C [Thiobacillus sp.]
MIRSTFLLASLVFIAPSAWANSIFVSNAWVRPTMPGQSVAGAYLDITAKKTARLVAVRSPISPDVQIHWMQMDGDVMRMREVGAIDLPKHTSVSLKPGGYHLMLMQLKKPIRAGEVVPLTLVIETQGKRENVKVRALAQTPLAKGAEAAHDHSHMHH